jgi:tetratricopeptide (TPR) repeat protein
MGAGLAAAAPAAVLTLLLILSTWYDGAFDLRYWAPIAVLGLVALVVAQLGGGIQIERGPRLVALVAIWAFAGWTMLSAAWADSAALAWEGAARTILYASAITLALAIPTRRQAFPVGAIVIAGVGAITAITLFTLFTGGANLFLAGRLDDPIGYRNGTATLFAFAFWPLLGVAAARGLNPVLRSATLSGAVVALGLAFLTQSRGVVIGLVAGGLVSIAIGPDRLRRAWLAVAAVGAIALVSGSLLGPYHAFQDGGAATDANVHDVARTLTILAVATFGLGLLAALLDNGLRPSRRDLTVLRGLAAAGLAALALVGIVAALVKIGNPTSYASDKWDEFTNLESEGSTTSTRLGSVGGQRYDLWRVAWSEFDSHPVGGVGEGSYRFDYFQERRTDRNLSDPHSLPLRLLAETGLVGATLFAVFLVAIAIAIARAARASEPEERRMIAGLAAAGAVLIGQSATDWLWLIPTLTGLGLVAISLAAAPPEAPSPVGILEDGRRASTPWRRAGRLAPALLLAAAAVSVGLLFLSDLYVRKARSEAGRSPSAQLSAARTAEDLNPVSVTPLYLQASALETMGDRAGARDALNQALDQEPDNFAVLALLGDLEARANDTEAARDYYRRALALDPRDIGLQKLAETGGR